MGACLRLSEALYKGSGLQANVWFSLSQRDRSGTWKRAAQTWRDPKSRVVISLGVKEDISRSAELCFKLEGLKIKLTKSYLPSTSTAHKFLDLFGERSIVSANPTDRGLLVLTGRWFESAQDLPESQISQLSSNLQSRLGLALEADIIVRPFQPSSWDTTPKGFTISSSSSSAHEVRAMVHNTPREFWSILQSAGIEQRGRATQLKSYYLNIPAHVVNQFPAKRILQALLNTAEQPDANI